MEDPKKLKVKRQQQQSSDTLGPSGGSAINPASGASGAGGGGESEEEDSQATPGVLQCRYYEREYPDVDECVLVQVRSISEMGAYVTLTEYNNIEGMILLSELTRRRFRSINKLIRVGKTEIAMVIRVDSTKGFIDLSKRRVTADDAIKCEERFNKAKAVNSIMRQVAQVSGKSLLEVNKMIAWPLARNPAFKTAYDALWKSLVNPEVVFATLGNGVDPYLIQLVQSNVKKRLAPQAIRVRADIEVSCFTYEGIDVVRSALMEGKKVDPEIQIRLIAPPLYVMLMQSLDKATGISAMERAIEVGYSFFCACGYAATRN